MNGVVVVARKTVEVRKPRDIGDAIRVVREARGISQEELAEANAYDRFYLNRLEAGRSTVYITRLFRTLKSLGITLSVTFDDGRSGDGKGARMAERLEVSLHGEQVGWITRGSRRERIEFEWLDGYTAGPVTLTESFGAVRSKAPSAAASSFFGGIRA